MLSFLIKTFLQLFVVLLLVFNFAPALFNDILGLMESFLGIDAKETKEVLSSLSESIRHLFVKEGSQQ